MQLYIKYGRFPKQGAVVKMFSQDNMEQVELATEAIDKYIEYRENKSFQKSLLCELCHCISIGISIWCGHTYIGEQKDPNELLIYQGFFYKLSILICTIERNSARSDQEELRFLESIKYNGTIFRYLGSSNHSNHDRIYPIPDSQYVSWTKDKDMIYPYISQKLYGPITLISYNIGENDFGIDLTGFYEYCRSDEIRVLWDCREFENEVVYHTPKISDVNISIIEDA